MRDAHHLRGSGYSREASEFESPKAQERASERCAAAAPRGISRPLRACHFSLSPTPPTLSSHNVSSVGDFKRFYYRARRLALHCTCKSSLTLLERVPRSVSPSPSRCHKFHRDELFAARDGGAFRATISRKRRSRGIGVGPRYQSKLQIPSNNGASEEEGPPTVNARTEGKGGGSLDERGEH